MLKKMCGLIKRFGICLIVFAVICFVAACSKEIRVPPADSPDGTGSLSCTYYPYRIGSEVTFSSNSGDYTSRITGEKTIKGITWLVAKRDGIAGESYNRCDGLYYMVYIPAQGGNDDFVLRHIRENGKPGETWADTLRAATGKYYYRHLVEAIENARVINGKVYKNVARMGVDVYIVQDTLADSLWYSYHEWFAPGVGPVESELDSIKLKSISL